MSETRFDGPMTPGAFAAETGIEAAQLDKLKIYLALLDKWRRSVNLVGPGSMADPWRRHMLDSAQLIPLLPPDRAPIADLGSGAGFPGMVVALLSGRTVHLIESNARKCQFLAEVARATGAPVKIRNARIEALDDFKAAILLSRALASVAEFLETAEGLLIPETTVLLLKGREAPGELTEAAKTWKYDQAIYQSRSDSHGKVVQLERISRRHV